MLIRSAQPLDCDDIAGLRVDAGRSGSPEHRRVGFVLVAEIDSGRTLLAELHRMAARMGCGPVVVTRGEHRRDEARRVSMSCEYSTSDRRFRITLNEG